MQIGLEPTPVFGAGVRHDVSGPRRHGFCVAAVCRDARLLLFLWFFLGLFSPAAPIARAENPNQAPFLVEPAFQEVVLKGYTRSETRVTLSAEVSGKALAVNYEEGQTVGKAPLVEIDPTFVDFQIAATRRSLSGLRISLRKNRSRVAFLDKEFRRVEKLYARNTAAEVKRDSAAQELEQARLDAETIESRMAELEIQLNELLERKKRHRIFAPQGWVVTAKLVEEGELVGAGAPVGRVADFRRLVVPLSVSDAELDALRRRSSPFTVGLGSRQVAASIHWINPEFDPRTRKLDVELRIEDDIPEKRGGLVCSLPLRIRAQGLRAPKAAVINRYDNPRVILAETGEAVPVLIVGQSDGYFFLSETAPLKPGTKLARPSEGKMP